MGLTVLYEMTVSYETDRVMLYEMTVSHRTDCVI